MRIVTCSPDAESVAAQPDRATTAARLAAPADRTRLSPFLVIAFLSIAFAQQAFSAVELWPSDPGWSFLLACNANRSWFLMNSFVYYKLITVKTIHGVNGPEIPYFSGVFLKTLAEMNGRG